MERGKKTSKKSQALSETEKTKFLAWHTEDGQDQFLTTNQGVRINDNQNSLKAGERGPSLLEDFILREKITHFDHERIPERVVHARGAGAHGFFQVYEPLTNLTKAAFLQDPALKTPVFVRFSTVAGSRGSTDLARDVRGFAVKFYTSEGVFDLVGNNIPVFFIQDAVKFPDLIHSVKPEPHNEIPQAASAHDTFWDFVSYMPESMHMIMWAMSDRAIPRSYRMMEGFGVHTFRLVNAKGKARFVKFHWKPLLGLHSVVWDEATKISGKDPDFHRRDLWEAIESGAFPEYELGVQIVEEKDEFKFDFDLLDPTKLIPEEVVPVQRIGKLTLNRNPDNFFAETEQVAFHPGHIVPGLDFTNDPLLQGRLFSYTDTQLTRLGSPNFHEIPINRSLAPVHNNQRDGHMRQTINRGQTSYDPNGLGGGCPFQAGRNMAGFASYPERIEAHKVRGRSESFFDHFTQARMFYLSQADHEREHIIKALQFELGKVEAIAVRERVVAMLSFVDQTLATRVGEKLGLRAPLKIAGPLNGSVPADEDARRFQPKPAKPNVQPSPALSMANTPKDTIATRKIACLVGDGFDEAAVTSLRKALESGGALLKLVAPHGGTVNGAKGGQFKVDFALMTTSSVLFDAVFVAGGASSVAALLEEAEAVEFVQEAFKHCKAVAASAEGVQLLQAAQLVPAHDALPPLYDDAGLLFGNAKQNGKLATAFINAIAAHRHWSREVNGKTPQLPAAPLPAKAAGQR